MADQHTPGALPPRQPPNAPTGGRQSGALSPATPTRQAAPQQPLTPMRVANPVPGASGAPPPSADDLLNAVGDGMNMALDAVHDVAKDVVAGMRNLMSDFSGPAPEPAAVQAPTAPPTAPPGAPAPGAPAPPTHPQRYLHQPAPAPRQQAPQHTHGRNISLSPPRPRRPDMLTLLSAIVGGLVIVIATPILLILTLFALGFHALFLPDALFLLAEGAAILSVWLFFMDRRDAAHEAQRAQMEYDERVAAAQRRTGQHAGQPAGQAPGYQLQPGGPTGPIDPTAPPPTPQLTPADFEEHEPSDPSDPFPHEDMLAIADKQGWAVVGASRRGWSHAHDAKYREDGLAGAVVNGWRLAAVADGGGAYSLARVGANLAVTKAVEAMREVARQQRADKLSPDQQKQVLQHMLLAGLGRAHQAVFEEATRRNVASGQLRTTLLLVATCELRQARGQPPTALLGAAQIGDGAIIARDATGQLIELGVPDTGQVGNETLFFQDVKPEDWLQRIKIESVAGPNCHCLAMTDGVSDDFIPLDVNLERLEKPLFASALVGKAPEAAAQAMLDLLAYKRNGSFDDRTLACIYQLK